MYFWRRKSCSPSLLVLANPLLHYPSPVQQFMPIMVKLWADSSPRHCCPFQNCNSKRLTLYTLLIIAVHPAAWISSLSYHMARMMLEAYYRLSSFCVALWYSRRGVAIQEQRKQGQPVQNCSRGGIVQLDWCKIHVQNFHLQLRSSCWKPTIYHLSLFVNILPRYDLLGLLVTEKLRSAWSILEQNPNVLFGWNCILHCAVCIVMSHSAWYTMLLLISYVIMLTSKHEKPSRIAWNIETFSVARWFLISQVCPQLAQSHAAQVFKWGIAHPAVWYDLWYHMDQLCIL